MKRLKKFIKSTSIYLNSLSSGATISILNPEGSIGFPRKQPNQQYVGDIISGDRREFSKEYISPNKIGQEILKSDAFQRVGDDMYVEKAKNQYSHHHITDDEEINTRLESIKNIADEQHKTFQHIQPSRSIKRISAYTLHPSLENELGYTNIRK